MKVEQYYILVDLCSVVLIPKKFVSKNKISGSYTNMRYVSVY